MGVDAAGRDQRPAASISCGAGGRPARVHDAAVRGCRCRIRRCRWPWPRGRCGRPGRDRWMDSRSVQSSSCALHATPGTGGPSPDTRRCRRRPAAAPSIPRWPPSRRSECRAPPHLFDERRAVEVGAHDGDRIRASACATSRASGASRPRRLRRRRSCPAGRRWRSATHSKPARRSSHDRRLHVVPIRRHEPEARHALRREHLVQRQHRGAGRDAGRLRDAAAQRPVASKPSQPERCRSSRSRPPWRRPAARRAQDLAVVELVEGALSTSRSR